MRTVSRRLRLLHVSSVALLCSLPAGSGATAQLTRTRHASVPRTIGHVWFVPDATYQPAKPERDALTRLASGMDAYRGGRYGEALTLLSRRGLPSSVADYASYYAGLSRLRLGQVAAARKELSTLRTRQPIGYLSEAAATAEADAAVALGDHAGATQIYEQLLKRRPSNPGETWLKLARTSIAVNDRSRAAEAYRRIHEEFPLSAAAVEAESWLEAAGVIPALSPGSARYRAAVEKADGLFEVKRYDEALRAYEQLQPHASPNDKRHVAIRHAACEYFLRRHAVARRALRRYATEEPARSDARFFDLMAARALGRHEEFAQLAYSFVAALPTDPHTEEVLDTLATFHIRRNEDDRADIAFRTLLSSFPSGRYSPRASWHVGWRAYRSGSRDEAAQVFEGAATRFPRSDYRAAYLYWAARARESLGHKDRAVRLFAIISADYRHSYYGLLAATRASGDLATDAIIAVEVTEAETGNDTSTAPPTAQLIRTLLYAGMYDEAMMELQYAQRFWGNTPALRATQAWIHSRKHSLLAASNAMKRAYPQYLTADAERLPSELLAVVYPLGFWNLLQRHARQHDLDPYLLAALVAQESSFIPDIRSPARATGLMQLVPATAARYARKLQVPHTRSLLTRPEANVRLGTAYFADLLREFGAVHLALASYNAGENRVRRWLAERRDLARDEFIDDIPFPETRTYVKKILGAAENYRRIYGSGTTLAIDPNRAIPSLASRLSVPRQQERAPRTTTRAVVTKRSVPTKPPRQSAGS